MNIKLKQIQKLEITNSRQGFDQIDVTLEDFGPSHGKITITHCGDAYTSSWGAMGEDRSASQFFVGCCPEYLIGCLIPGLNSRITSEDGVEGMIKQAVIEKRRKGELEKYEAREMFDSGDYEALTSGMHFFTFVEGDICEKLFDCNFWELDLPQEVNPRYRQMEELVEAVQEAIRQVMSTKAA